MPFRKSLPSISRYTFGTGNTTDVRNPEHINVVRAAMEDGDWFHSSDTCGNGGTFEVLWAALKETPSSRTKGIFKVDGQGADLLRAVVEESTSETGVRRVDLAQVCGNPASETLTAGIALHDTMVELQNKGQVGRLRA